MASSSAVLARLGRSASLGPTTLSFSTRPFQRSFVFLARRSAFPYARQLFPSELLTPPFSVSRQVNNFSTSPFRQTPATAEAVEDAEVAEFESGEPIPDSTMPFSSLEGKVHEKTLMAITQKPFKHTHLSPVQEKILPLLPELIQSKEKEEDGTRIAPQDLMVKAKTGTGKTLAFIVPALESRLSSIKRHVDEKVSELAARGIIVSTPERARVARNFAVDNAGVLILSPTRELATQIAVETMNLSSHHRDIGVQVILGGASKARQMKEWKGRKDFVVATPGRIIDLLQSEPSVEAALRNTELLILDEADTLLDMGFQSAIEQISSYLPKKSQRQTFLFSATISNKVREVAKTVMSLKHRYINCVSEDDSPVHAHIPQYHTVLPSGEQALPHLLRLIAQDQLLKQKEGSKSKIVIFFSTTKMVQMFAEMLRSTTHVLPVGKNTSVYEMHGQRDMDRRIATSRSFRNDSHPASILVTSDVSARGVDYPGVSRVIQVGLPGSKDMYVHRVGRTGRGGNKEGRGDLVISPWELDFVKKQMADVDLKPVTVEGVKTETEELAKELVDARGKSYLPALSTLEDVANVTSTSFSAAEISEPYLSQLGFFLGHAQDLGLQMQGVADGLGRYFQQLGGLEGPPALSRTMRERLEGGIAKMDRYGQKSRRPAWGSFATGRDNRGLGRNEHRGSIWESGGSGFRGSVGSERDKRPSRFNEWEKKDRPARYGDKNSGEGGYRGARRSDAGSEGGYRGSRRSDADSEGGYRGSRRSDAGSEGGYRGSRRSDGDSEGKRHAPWIGRGSRR